MEGRIDMLGKLQPETLRDKVLSFTGVVHEGTLVAASDSIAEAENGEQYISRPSLLELKGGRELLLKALWREE